MCGEAWPGRRHRLPGGNSSTETHSQATCPAPLLRVTGDERPVNKSRNALATASGSSRASAARNLRRTKRSIAAWPSLTPKFPTLSRRRAWRKASAKKECTASPKSVRSSTHRRGGRSFGPENRPDLGAHREKSGAFRFGCAERFFVAVCDYRFYDAEYDLVQIKITRGLRHRQPPFAHQPHRLKLELAAESSSFYALPLISSSHLNSVSVKPAAAQ